MKNNSKYFIAAIVFILVFCFYWYDIRPTSIKQGCYNEATQDYQGGEYQNTISEIGVKYTQWAPFYSACLRRQGM